MTTNEWIARIREALAATTPGEWHLGIETDTHADVEGEHAELIADAAPIADARFIANSKQWIETMLPIVEAAVALVEGATDPDNVYVQLSHSQYRALQAVVRARGEGE